MDNEAPSAMFISGVRLLAYHEGTENLIYRQIGNLARGDLVQRAEGAERLGTGDA